MAELTFSNPEYLWLILSIPLLIITHFYLLKHSRQKALKFANFETIKRVTGKSLLTKNISILSIRIAVLLMVILSVSGTTVWYEGLSNKNNFVIAVDVSASMLTEDLTPTRIDAAKQQAVKFIDALANDVKVGVVTFAGTTYVNQIPTRDKVKVKEAIEKIDLITAGGTDIPGAIITSANLLADSNKGKTIILISDGSSTIGSYIEESISDSVRYAQNNHILIHTIGTGRNTEEPIGYIPEYYNISSVYNKETLERISSDTKGNYYHAVDNEKLIEAYKEIAKDSELAILKRDISFGLMVVALVLLFIEWGLINTRFRKTP